MFYLFKKFAFQQNRVNCQAHPEKLLFSALLTTIQLATLFPLANQVFISSDTRRFFTPVIPVKYHEFLQMQFPQF